MSHDDYCIIGEMRRLNYMSNLSRLGKVEFDLKLSNLIDLDVASHRQLILELNSAPVKFDV